MHEVRFGVGLVACLVGVLQANGETPLPTPAETGCLVCHKGIEPIRESGSKMLAKIRDQGDPKADPEGCCVCHGGDPTAKDKAKAHGGNAFYPDPGSPWINRYTCGQCHPSHVRVQWHNLMMTEAGKIQGTAWAFGSLTGYEHRWGNYAVENPRDPTRRLGTDAYRAYKERLKTLEPQVFVDRHLALPDAPTDLAQVEKHPELAAFTYMRNQCQRCHNAVKGRQVRGDYRGMGCSSCHIPYGAEGMYEGGDASIPHDKPGHMLVHTIQSTRKAKVTVHGHQYSGIPMETCAVCHNRGKRIGVSFQGLMEIPWASPYTKDGKQQPELHTKHYMAMHQDLHYKKGMLCQDCHTSLDVHSDGFLAASNLAQVEIECADCHGTPEKYPWELPLGFQDEFGDVLTSGPPRGTATELLEHTKQGTTYPVRDGFLLTARGNPFPHVVRDGNGVVVHTAAGKDLALKPLKQIKDEKTFGVPGEFQGHNTQFAPFSSDAADFCFGPGFNGRRMRPTRPSRRSRKAGLPKGRPVRPCPVPCPRLPWACCVTDAASASLVGRRTPSGSSRPGEGSQHADASVGHGTRLQLRAVRTRQEMALDQDNPRDMPRLLEPGWVPPPSHARRFWEYLHRWRVSLFHHCIREG